MGFTVRLRNIAMLVVLDAGDICTSVNTLAIVGSQYNVIRDSKLYMFTVIHLSMNIDTYKDHLDVEIYPRHMG